VDRVISLDRRSGQFSKKVGRNDIIISAQAVLDALRKARRLIVKPANWSRYDLAQDANGVACDYRSPHAVRFTGLGAVWRVCPTWELQRACNAALDPTNGTDTHISWLNKYEGHEAVLAAFNAAIKRLSRELEGDDAWLRS